MDFQLIGSSELDSSEKDMLNELIDQYWNRMQRAVHQDIKMVLHVKKYSGTETETRKGTKYSINVRIEAPGKVLEANESGFGEMNVITKKAFEHILKIAEKRFKQSSGFKKTKVK
ncbi:hypothetical protein JW968_04360 [Candidatus Woesearchaeota archaeon]|nr:hypothetical protein [Candidatus Woesearchaeota archaeon]